MKKYLETLIARKKAEIVDLQKRSDASEDINEVRSIGKTIDALTAEVKEAEAQMDALNIDERSAAPKTATLRNAQVVGSYTEKRSDDENVEYRTAFMNYVLRGTPIPAELRADANTLTSDAATVIPTHLVDRIVEKFDSVGMILPLITKTAYAAGVEIPTSTVKPVATWVAEGAGSDRQKKTTGKISFTYHKLRCEISMSMEVGAMALAAFEAKFVENVSKAMTYAVEDAIINGSGSGQPTGILKATVPTGQAITGALSYAKLCEAEGAIPVEYEVGAKWCMNKKTFAQILGMSDADGHPIARINYGIAGKPERTILGRDVVISPYVADGKAFAFDFADYVLNTIYDMGISKKQDWETEDLLTKAVMSVDGKVVDNGSLVTLAVTSA
jgi:HK97 family phage major capsid protein